MPRRWETPDRKDSSSDADDRPIGPPGRRDDVPTEPEPPPRDDVPNDPLRQDAAGPVLWEDRDALSDECDRPNAPGRRDDVPRPLGQDRAGPPGLPPRPTLRFRP